MNENEPRFIIECICLSMRTLIYVYCTADEKQRNENQ